jgi:aryl-alcohol dehydrogenase-like predicted oxidoreductase
MLYRQLGSTGVEVSVIGMGGSNLGQAKVEEDLAIRLIHEGLDRGINFLDNSWDYNEGRSEERVGKALLQGGYRQKAFVMTKLDGRTKDVAAAQIDTSLKRLKVDHIQPRGSLELSRSQSISSPELRSSPRWPAAQLTARNS